MADSDKTLGDRVKRGALIVLLVLVLGFIAFKAIPAASRPTLQPPTGTSSVSGR